MTYYGDEFTKHPELPDGQTKKSIDFLKKFCPTGPWILTSIVPDGGTTTETFTRDETTLLTNWIEARQGNENVYFHVNPMLRRLSNKASKEDVKSLDWLHVDIDPRVGEDIDQERNRILHLLKTYEKKPTVILFSGGGYQAFWRLQLSDKLDIDGDIAKAENCEAYNIQLAHDLGADHCHNVDRIMRLPGTINIPTQKKRARGRIPLVATVMEWNDVDYPIEAFIPAPRVQTEPGVLGCGRPRVTISGNIPEMGVKELREWADANNKIISDHCLALITVGQDPLDPGKYPSRSEALFRVCCDLLRAEVPDDIIYAVITGPNEIAASVKEKPHWETYALRQIERAKDEVVDPVLRKLNEKHAVIADMGGKCRVISEVYDSSLNRTKINKQSFEDFRNRYRHIKVQVGTDERGHPVQRSAGTYWLDNPMRRQYETIVFSPGKEVDGAYNLWKGFGCTSIQGDKHESFLKHIHDNICSSNETWYNYLVNWMAQTVQEPARPGEVAIVLRGKRGTGKSFFAKSFGRLWGRHFVPVADSKHLVGNFNAHLRDAVLVFGDEAFFAGDRQNEGTLKTLITEEVIQYEPKGVDSEAGPNYIHLILASNDSWVIPAGLDERRFFVLDVGVEKIQNHGYFERIKNDLDNGGLENLLHFLLTKNIKHLNLRQAPATDALMDQKILSMSPEHEWFYQLLVEGKLLPTHDRWESRAPSNAMYDNYLLWMDRQRKNYRLSMTAFGKFLHGCCPSGWPIVKKGACKVPWVNEIGYELLLDRRVTLNHFPTLKEMRAYWDKHMGGPFNWPEEELDLPPTTEEPVSPF